MTYKTKLEEAVNKELSDRFIDKASGTVLREQHYIGKHFADFAASWILKYLAEQGGEYKKFTALDCGETVETIDIRALLASEAKRVELEEISSRNADNWIKYLKKCEELEKVLLEVKSCKIGNLVVYNPNGEDKDAAFVASLVHSVQAENDKLQTALKVSEARVKKAVDENTKLEALKRCWIEQFIKETYQLALSGAFDTKSLIRYRADVANRITKEADELSKIIVVNPIFDAELSQITPESIGDL